MAEDRIGGITEQSIKAIVLLNSDETTFISGPHALQQYTLALLPPENQTSRNQCADLLRFLWH